MDGHSDERGTIGLRKDQEYLPNMQISYMKNMVQWFVLLVIVGVHHQKNGIKVLQLEATILTPN